MAVDSRTYTVTSPHMEGGGIDNWQRRLNSQMKAWAVDYRIAVDGGFGVLTRDLGRTVAYGGRNVAKRVSNPPLDDAESATYDRQIT